MLIALLLFLGGGFVGLYSHVLIAFGLSALVVVLSIAAWTIRGETTSVGVLVLFAHLTALQAGYLAGAYLGTHVRSDDPE